MSIIFINCFYTAKYAILYPTFSWYGPHVYTEQGNIVAWFRTPIYPLEPYTYLGFHFHVNEIRQHGPRAGTWVEVLLRCSATTATTQRYQHQSF